MWLRTACRGLVFEIAQMLDIHQAFFGQSRAHVVDIQTEFPGFETRTFCLFIGHAGLCCLEHRLRICAGDDDHTVIVCDDDIAGPDIGPGHDDRHVDRTDGLLDSAFGRDDLAPDRELHFREIEHIPHAGIDDQTARALSHERSREQIAEHTVGVVRTQADNDDIAGLYQFGDDVHHPVVARVSEHCRRTACDARAGVHRSHVGLQQSRASLCFVHRCNAEFAQCIDNLERRSLEVTDCDSFHGFPFTSMAWLLLCPGLSVACGRGRLNAFILRAIIEHFAGQHVSMSSPLAGLRVVEMTEALAGPWCAMMLGDFGADVIKVERRGCGDQTRTWGPPFLEGESAYYLSVNRNKRGIALDIRQSEDLAMLHQLLADADVFITNNPRIESLQRAQLDPETLHALNSRLIYVAISGYGHSGPKANRGGYDIIAQGEAGLMSLTGAPDGEANRFPTPMADISAGIYATIATLTSLYARDAGNRDEEPGGQFIDVALVDSQTTWLANVAGSYFATGERPPRLGNAHPTITPYQPVRASDRDMMIAVGNDRLWQKFCGVLSIEDTLMNDARFATNPQRNQSREALMAELAPILATKTADEWIESLVAAGVPAGPVNFPDEILSDDHILARDMIVELEHPAIGTIRSLAFPGQFAHSGPTYRRYPPRLGEHNDEVAAQLRERSR